MGLRGRAAGPDHGVQPLLGFDNAADSHERIGIIDREGQIEGGRRRDRLQDRNGIARPVEREQDTPEIRRRWAVKRIEGQGPAKGFGCAIRLAGRFELASKDIEVGWGG